MHSFNKLLNTHYSLQAFYTSTFGRMGVGKILNRKKV